MSKAFDDVVVERLKQREQWGYPQPAMRDPALALAILAEEFGEASRAVVELVVPNDDKTIYAGFTRQEKWLRNLRDELIQTAAVAIQFAEHIDDGHIRVPE